MKINVRLFLNKMTEKYLELNLEDEKAGKVAEILASKTAKKILGLIAENEMSENDIALKLKIPLNTIDYNVKKLLEAGLIEESKNFFWSVKGRKIKTFRAANKKIIISTKPVFRGILPFVLISGAVGFAASVLKNIFSVSSKLYGSSFANVASNVAEKVSDSSNALSSMPADSGEQAVNLINDVASSNPSFLSLFHNTGIWIVAGILSGLIIFFVYKKIISVRGSNKL